MKSIYFKNNDQSSYLKSALKLSTHAMTKVSPRLSSHIALKILCNPFSRRRYEFETLVSPSDSFIQTKLGKVQTYHFANEGKKHVLLNHGWADNSWRFNALINELHEKGFDIWTLDHIGHGKSEGRTSHLFGYIDGLTTFLNCLESQGIKLDGVVSHSMGGIALLNIDHQLIAETKKVFVSSPVMFFENMYEKISQIGISDSTLTNLLEKVSRDYDRSWEELKPQSNMKKIDEYCHFIHDVNDRVASFESLNQLVRETPATLLSTSNLGHVRILKDKEVIENISQLLIKQS